MWCSSLHHDSRNRSLLLWPRPRQARSVTYLRERYKHGCSDHSGIFQLSNHQFFLWGFTLVFSDSGSPIIGDLSHIVLSNVAETPFPSAPAIPAITLFFYQLGFAAVTPAIIFGAVADRIRLVPSIVFIFVWTTLVYDFVAYWTWGYRGWLRNLDCLSTTSLGETPCGIGHLDFAGGGPVHIASGFAGLAYSLFLGKRTKRPISGPANLTMVFLGTALLWFGWLGFNGGSSLDASARSSLSTAVTIISSGFGAISWMTFDYIFTRKISGVGLCMGAIAGLVTVTPASGFVAPWAAAIIGTLAGVVVNQFARLKEKLGYDDTLDAFGIHGVAGVLGNILTGVFHQAWVPSLSGGERGQGGVVEGNWKLLGYQIVGSLSIAIYTFVMSYAILFVIDLIPGMSLRGGGDTDADVDLQEMGNLKEDQTGDLYTLTNEASSTSTGGQA
jgi:Amt family ammonium transporter